VDFVLKRGKSFGLEWYRKVTCRGGDTVLKVEGQIMQAKRAKNFLTPTFWPVVRQNIA